MPIPVINIPLSEFLAIQNQEIFSIPLFCRIREIKATGNDRFLIDNQYLVVSYGVFSVNISRNAHVKSEVGGAVAFGLVAFIQDNDRPDAPFVRLNQCLGDILARETIGLD